MCTGRPVFTSTRVAIAAVTSKAMTADELRNVCQTVGKDGLCGHYECPKWNECDNGKKADEAFEAYVAYFESGAYLEEDGTGWEW